MTEDNVPPRFDPYSAPHEGLIPTLESLIGRDLSNESRARIEQAIVEAFTSGVAAARIVRDTAVNDLGMMQSATSIFSSRLQALVLEQLEKQIADPQLAAH